MSKRFLYIISIIGIVGLCLIENAQCGNGSSQLKDSEDEERMAEYAVKIAGAEWAEWAKLCQHGSCTKHADDDTNPVTNCHLCAKESKAAEEAYDEAVKKMLTIKEDKKKKEEEDKKKKEEDEKEDK